jgi:hypothetical protein
MTLPKGKGQTPSKKAQESLRNAQAKTQWSRDRLMSGHVFFRNLASEVLRLRNII